MRIKPWKWRSTVFSQKESKTLSGMESSETTYHSSMGLACREQAVKNSAVFGGRIYRTPVLFLVRQDLCRMQILLHKRSNASSKGVVFVFCRPPVWLRVGEEKWRGHIIMWRMKRRVGRENESRNPFPSVEPSNQTCA